MQITEEDSVIVETTTIDDKERELLESASSILLSISNTQGDFTERHVDTRTKERPTRSDLKSINKVITTLMSQSELSPGGDPFQYLWIANCVLYSVIVAFLLLKGWKKNTPDHSNNSRKPTPKWKIVYEKKVMETRKKISIAKAEMERIKENRKLTKRGRKNRAFLEKECRKISVLSS